MVEQAFPLSLKAEQRVNATMPEQNPRSKLTEQVWPDAGPGGITESGIPIADGNALGGAMNASGRLAVR